MENLEKPLEIPRENPKKIWRKFLEAKVDDPLK